LASDDIPQSEKSSKNKHKLSAAVLKKLFCSFEKTVLKTIKK